MHIQPTFRANRDNRQTGTADLLAAMQPASLTFYPTDATIYAQGDIAGPLYFVEFGAVRLCQMTADGRRLVTAFHTAGEVFGFEADSEHQCYAESVDGAGIRVLRPQPGQQPTASMLTLAIRSLARTQQHLMLLGRRTAGERMAAFIADLAERQGGERMVHLAMQRNDIADYLGLTFETVSRTLRVLKDQGIIRLPSVDKIEVLDFDALQSLCD